jgi:hypothetical protein
VSFNLRDCFRSQIVSGVVIECDVGAFTREHFADRRPDAARSSADKRALPLEQ